MKQNDWIVATLNNPEFTASDFKNVQGLSLDNTQLLSKDEYLKSSFITNNDAFKNNDGTFNRDKFNTFYNDLSKKFSDFLLESALDNYTYGFWDTSRKPNSKVDTPQIGVEVVLNPEHRSFGVLGLGIRGDREFSDMELALLQNIFDYSNNKYLDYTANDHALFSNPLKFFKELFNEPLVLATYDLDEDTINPITGQLEHHTKGEKKLNGAGEYYLETLGGRSVVGKNVLSVGDIITSDTSSINKYDFFDSDGLEKNTSGVIAKNLAAIAPMLFLNPVGAGIYSGLYVAREMSKTLPMLFQMFTSLYGNTSDSKFANTLAAYGLKFTGGTSEYSKENTFTFENFGNLISDVALLWGQQKVIANTVSKLGKSANEVINSARGRAMYEYEKQALNILNRAERGEQLLVLQYTGQLTRQGIKDALTNGSWENSIIGQAALKKFLPDAEKAYAKRLKFGQDLSLAYMALISNTDVYDSAIEHGATKREAAAMALGSTIGMFSVDKYLGLGEMFFDDPDAIARRTFKQAIRSEAEQINSKIGTLGTTSTAETRYLDFINKGIKAAKNAVTKYHSNVKDRALSMTGKALGEGLEEVSEELVTDMTKSLYELAGTFGYTSTNDVGAWDNARDRYLMSFFGGAIGGGMFGGIEAIKNPKSAFDKNNQKELLYLVKEGKTRDILELLDKLHEKGELGNTELSIDTQDKTFITSDADHKSQNDFVYDVMKNSILLMDSIINENQLNISDDKLFERMVISDPKFIALKDVLQGKSYITGYYDQYQQFVESLYANEVALRELEDSTPDPEKRKSTEYLELMLQLMSENQRIKQNIEDFKSGKYSLEYVDRMLFAMNPEISGKFLSMNFNLFVRENYGKDIDKLSESELNKARENWDNYNKTSRKLEFEKAYNLYKLISKRINPVLQKLSESSDLNSWNNILQLLQDTFPTSYFITPEQVGEIEGESELSPEEIYKRKSEIASQTNKEKLSEFILIFANNNSIIDTSTYRKLMGMIGVRRKDVVSQNILQRVQFNGIEDDSKFKEAISKLNEDFSNIDLVKEETTELARQYILKHLNYPNAEVDFSPIEGKGYYTFSDLLDIINNSIGNKPVSEEDIDDIFEGTIEGKLSEDLILAHNMELNPEQGLELEELIANYPSYTGYGIENAVIIGNNKHEEIIQNELEQFTTSINESLNQVISEILQDPYYKALTDIKKKITFNNNPTLRLIKAIATNLGDNFSDIENTLQSIYEQYERLDNILDYLLNDEQLKALEQAQQYIDLAEGFIRAASTLSNYFHVMPFYKTINEFNKAHKDVLNSLEELPELTSDIANVSLLSLQEYKDEIETWISRSRENSLNKIREFKDFDLKFSKIKLDFLKNNMTKEGFGEDLIDGIDNIEWDKPDALFEVEKLLHYNFKRTGKSAKDLIPIIKKVIGEYKNNIDFLNLKTSDLNGNITPEKFTTYDKFTYILSILAEDPISFNIYYKLFIESNNSIAPLAFLEHAIRLAHAQEVNPKLINDVFREIIKDVPYFTRRYIPNTTIITGLGGAGKSLVVARALSTSDNIWFSGPSDTLILNLLTLNPNGTAKTKEELFSEILEPNEYLAVMAEYNAETKDGKKLNVRHIKDIGRTVVLKDIKYKKIQNPPKKIVIDEITLFNNVELQLLANWAEKNGVSLLVLGDENLNGDNGAGRNIQPEYNFAFRAPRLSISLRLGNYWKFVNQKPIEEMLNDLRGASTRNLFDDIDKRIRENDLKNYKFHYYLQNGTLTGDFLTTKLDDSIIQSLNGSIGFVGDTSSSAWLTLKNSGKEITLLNPTLVLGLEFDYVIIDLDWKLSKEDSLGEYLQNLYTMITRSRKGSVIIDNYLSDNTSGNKEENYSTDAITLNPQAIEDFTKAKLEYLNSLDLTPRIIEQPSQLKSIPVEIDTPIETPPAPEEISGQINTTLLEEQSKLEVYPEAPISENPYTAYSNIEFTGLTTQVVDKKEVWMKNGSLRDLDILLSDEALRRQLLKIDKLDTVKSKIEYTEYLMKLKSFIQFGGDYKKLPNIIKNIFSEEDINNMEYYIVSEDFNNDKHQILRILQGLKDEKTSFISDSRNIPQVISLLGRITKNGKTYTLTLGLLQSLQNSKDTKDILYDLVHRQNPEMSLDLLNSEVDKILNKYDSEIKVIVNLKLRKINKPYFTKTTGLRKVNRLEYRLKEVNQTRDRSKYEYATIGYVTSPIYTIVDPEEIDKLGLSRNLVGKPIMYVSANSNLNSKDLASIYLVQKADPSNNTPEVRCVVLNIEGVSFESLIRPAYSKTHYEIKVSDKKQFHNPFTSLPMAIRMYVGLWNFRANLINFNKAVQDEFGSELTLADELAKLDSNLYQQAKGDLDYITREVYENWVKNTQTQDIQDKLKRIWDFNDKLTQDGIREFRLGYSTVAGAYVRKLNDSENVIYINRDLAEKYENSIKNLFTNVIDANEDGSKGLIPPISDNIQTFIDKKATFDKWQELEENWVKNLQQGGSLEVDTSEGVVNHSFGAAERIRMLPTILKQININLLSRGYDVLQWEEELKQGRHKIKIGEDSLDYMSLVNGIFDPIETITEGIVADKPIGTEYYNFETKEGLIDKRVVNMFNLAFHGVPHTREFNDLKSFGMLKATDALFPNGFFVDTFISSEHTNGINKEVLTDREFYSTNVVPSGPIIKFSFNTAENVELKQESSAPNSRILEILKINIALGINLSEDTDKDILEDIIDSKLKENINLLFDGSRNDNILDLYVNYDGNNFITLREELSLKYPNLIEFKKLSDVQYEFISNGKTYYLQKGSLSGTYIIKETKPQILSTPDTKIKSASVKLISNYILSKLLLDSEEVSIFEETFVGKDGSAILNKESLLRRISKLRSEFDNDVIIKIRNIINNLPDATNGTCTVPIE